ncbi:MAG: hypothetical protein D6737_05810 [Chloroflexi bacterium]|nr:MAG: hypothetical protein D6737_05810 [Chloroflexota bacterium]
MQQVSSQTTRDTIITRIKEERAGDLDEQLPVWARRSNPIVRRHLGIYWKTLPPDINPIIKLYLVQVVIILLTVPIPFLTDAIMPVITVSVVLLPMALLLYAQVLFLVSSHSVITVTNEIRNDTLDVMRMTPYSMRELLLSKISASVWRQAENIGLLMYAVTLLMMPILVMQYGSMWDFREYLVEPRLAIIAGMAAAIVRIVLETLMVAAMAAAVGAMVRVRNMAIIVATIPVFFYFLFINLLRLLPLSWPLRMLVEIVLPLALPVVIIYGALYIAERAMTGE